jgi:focal adhesion kinase 1
MTTVEDIIRVVIKGRLSLNELRYKKCFSLRSTKLSQPTKDFEPAVSSQCEQKHSPNNKQSSDSEQTNIDDHFWLKNDLTIKEWIEIVKNDTDYWKLQLRTRFLSSDLNEIKFKDPITFNYYYEQIKNDFIQFIAPTITDPELIPNLLDLGCLEIRRSFQNMNPNVLDKKINYDYLEKDVGLKRFFPEIFLQQKSKNIKKMIIKGMKIYDSLNEIDCMLKYLDKLLSVWKYNEETYECHLGSAWTAPIKVTLDYSIGISCFMDNSNGAFQTTPYEKIISISTVLDENKQNGLLKLKIIEAKEVSYNLYAIYR